MTTTDLKPGTPVTIVRAKHPHHGKTGTLEAPIMGRTPPGWVIVRYDHDRQADPMPASYVQPVAK